MTLFEISVSGRKSYQDYFSSYLKWQPALVASNIDMDHNIKPPLFDCNSRFHFVKSLNNIFNCFLSTIFSKQQRLLLREITLNCSLV